MMCKTGLGLSGVSGQNGELTKGTFRREPRTVEARQPIAVRVGNSPSDTMCWSASKFFSSNRTQLEGNRHGKVTLEPRSPYTCQEPRESTVHADLTVFL